jgi:hypothetical protein
MATSASASTSVPLSKKGQQAFTAYYNSMQDLQSNSQSELRIRMEAVDKAYQREVDETTDHQKAKQANKAGDVTRIQNIVVPVVMPQVETAVTYQASVFLTGYPLFGVVANPEYIDAALQLETILEENSLRGGWVRQLLLTFRDGFKHNFGPMEVSWAQEVTASVETNLTKSVTQGIPKKVIWSGNKLKHLDPYNTFVDPRVPPTEVHTRGEFAGYTEYMPRIELKTFINSLPDKIIANIHAAFASGLGGGTARTDASARNYFVPSINPAVTDPEAATAGTNWMAWVGIGKPDRQGMKYKDTYEVTTLYCRVLPSEFDMKIPEANTPQIFKLIIVNHEHIVYCERQTNAHNYLPILITQPKEDGLGYQTKSLAQDAQPFQEVATAMMTSIMASRRRAISDRVLYDPSRIAKAHINSANPSAKIPVRPAAYGKKISEAVYQFPYKEDQASFAMQQIQVLMGLANQTSGQNQASQGQFVKGNKTLEEFDTVMQNANGRDQTAAILLEHQLFTPMKYILKLNTLQFQGGTTLYNQDKEVAVEIDPVQLRKAVLNFKVSDGLIPSSKLINADSTATALQALVASPQIAAGYNLGPLFSYFMKTRGAKITEFEKSQEQQAYEQALDSWQQLATTAVENGIDPEKLPPQPKPEEFGYNPAGNVPAPDKPESQSATNLPAPGPQ